jgi:gamma-glutamyltranspeptidase/glutathione hydrolase
MTTTVESYFGSHIMVRGFMLNNQLTDFSFNPTENGKPVANRVQAGKRPRSSMAPTLVFDRKSGRLVAALGSPGGSQIIEYVSKTLVGLLDWNMDVQQAVSMANFGSRNGPTEVERGLVTPQLVQALKDQGHQVAEIEMTSGTQAIMRKAGRMVGQSGLAALIHGVRAWRWAIECVADCTCPARVRGRGTTLALQVPVMTGQ